MGTTVKGFTYPEPQDSFPAFRQTLEDNALRMDAVAGATVMDTVARDALAGSDLWSGRAIFNSDTDLVEFYNGTAWVSLEAPDLEPTLEALAEHGVRLWELEANLLSTTENFADWQGDAFLTGQDNVASHDGAITRALRLADGFFRVGSPPEEMALDTPQEFRDGAASRTAAIAPPGVVPGQNDTLTTQGCGTSSSNTSRYMAASINVATGGTQAGMGITQKLDTSTRSHVKQLTVARAAFGTTTGMDAAASATMRVGIYEDDGTGNAPDLTKLRGYAEYTLTGTDTSVTDTVFIMDGGAGAYVDDLSVAWAVIHCVAIDYAASTTLQNIRILARTSISPSGAALTDIQGVGGVGSGSQDFPLNEGFYVASPASGSLQVDWAGLDASSELVTDPLDVSPVGTVGASSVTWAGTGTITVEARVDGGTWNVVTSSGDPVPGLNGTAASTVEVRVTLGSTTSNLDTLSVEAFNDATVALLTLDAHALAAQATEVYVLDDFTSGGAGAGRVYEASLDGGTTWDTVPLGDITALTQAGSSLVLRVTVTRDSASDLTTALHWLIVYAL